MNNNIKLTENSTTVNSSYSYENNESYVSIITDIVKEKFKCASNVNITESIVSRFFFDRLVEDNHKVTIDRMSAMAKNMYFNKNEQELEELINYICDKKISAINEKLNIHISELGLTKDVVNKLMSAKIETIKDIVANNSKELSKQISSITTRKLNEQIKCFGYKLLTKEEENTLKNCGIYNIKMAMCCSVQDLERCGVYKSLIRRLYKYNFINSIYSKNSPLIKEINVENMEENNKFRINSVVLNSDRILSQLLNKSNLPDNMPHVKLKINLDINKEPDVDYYINMIKQNVFDFQYIPTQIIIDNYERIGDAIMRADCDFFIREKCLTKLRRLKNTYDRKLDLDIQELNIN